MIPPHRTTIDAARRAAGPAVVVSTAGVVHRPKRKFVANLVFCAFLVAVACLPNVGCAEADTPARASSRPQRICSVNLAADEMLAELVDCKRLVGVCAYVDDAMLSNASGVYPPEVARVRADLERIVSLRPDLVCVNPYNSADFLDLLHRSGLPVFRYDAITSIEGIEGCILELGRRVGAADRAEAVVRSMRTRLDAIAATVVNIQKKPRVFYWAASWTAGKGSTIGEIIERAGGINAGAGRGRTGMYELSVEQMIDVDPDVLLLDARDSLADLPGRELPPQVRSMRAVREGRVVYVPGRALTALSQHVVLGVEILASELHPGLFAKPAIPTSDTGNNTK